MAKYMYATQPNYGRKKVFEEAVNQYFDLSDKETRLIMTGPLLEEDQNRMIVSLTTRLYDLIMDKVDDIDYGEIPRTKGDLTKLSNYNNMVECIGVLTDLFTEYKQSLNPVNTIRDAMNNIIKRKDTFQKAFILNMEFPIFLYDTIALSIVQSLSLMISTCIEFIKAPNNDTVDIILNNAAVAKTARHLLFNDLKKFNDACASGDIDKALTQTMSTKNKENLLGGSVYVTAGFIMGVVVLFNIIPIMRELIYFFYHSRTTFSDYLAVQADLLQVNAYNVEHNRIGKSADERKRIAKRQMKVVESLRKVSNVLAVDAITAEKKTTVEIVNDNKKKYKASDVMDSMPDSVANTATSQTSIF